MITDSVAYLRARLASRRALLQQATDAMAMQALRNDVAEIERMMAASLDASADVVDFAAYKKLTKSG
jgi:prophage DNA circulation protein